MNWNWTQPIHFGSLGLVSGTSYLPRDVYYLEDVSGSSYEYASTIRMLTCSYCG